MTENRTSRIAQLQEEIARLQSVLATLDGIPDAQQSPREQLQAREQELAALQGNPIPQPPTAQSEPNTSPIHGAITLSSDARISGVAVGINLGRIIYGRDPEDDERRRLSWYLANLANKIDLVCIAHQLCYHSN